MPSDPLFEVPTFENLELSRQRAELNKPMLDAEARKRQALKEALRPDVGSALDTAAAFLSPMITAPISAAYGAGRAMLSPVLGPVNMERVPGGNRYATPQDQAAANLMQFITYQPRTQAAQDAMEYAVRMFDASKLPHIMPEAMSVSKGPGAMRYAGTALDLPGYSRTAPIGAVDLSKRKFLTLPKLEEKSEQVPVVNEALPLAEDLSRREFLKQSAANVAANTVLGATPVGVLTKLAAEPVVKTIVEAPLTETAKVITPGYKELSNLVKDQLQTYLIENSDMPEGAVSLGYFWQALSRQLKKQGVEDKAFKTADNAAERLTWLDEESESISQKDIDRVKKMIEKHGNRLTARDFLDAFPEQEVNPFDFDLYDANTSRKWLNSLLEEYDMSKQIEKTDIENMLRDVFPEAVEEEFTQKSKP